MLPRMVATIRKPNIDRQRRRRAGIHRRTSRPRTAPPLALPHRFPASGHARSLLLAAVVLMVAVAVALVVEAPRVTDCVAEHVGGSLAPVGCAVTAQVRVTVPA
jgi:hypothetical protein